jgi:hypothetical protein
LFSARVLYLVGEIFRGLQNSLNWRLVRGLGELQILTRASYLLLVLVPLMASLWPAVRLVVNQHNQAVNEAARLLGIAKTDLERVVNSAKAHSEEAGNRSGASASRPTSEPSSEIISELKVHIRKIAELGESYSTDYKHRVITSPIFPWSLGAAFFAALFVVLGHLVYQLRAPEQLRSFTWDGFILSRKDDFAKHPTNDALARARSFVDTRFGRRLAESDRYHSEEILHRLITETQEDRRSILGELSGEQLRALVDWLESGDGHTMFPQSYKDEILDIARTLSHAAQTPDSVRDMTSIERGARAEYLRLATLKPFSTILTSILYGLAVWLIMLVIKDQAAAVIQAAGWKSLGDLLVH